MSARIVRAHYDELSQIASTFSQHAELTRKTFQELRQQQEALRGGDWLGQGAQAFYAEMDSQVLPTFNRLIRALDAANETTAQIRELLHQAEDECARILHANGTGSPGAGLAGVSAFTGPTPAAAPQPQSGSGSGSAGTTAGRAAPTPQQTAQALVQHIDMVQAQFGDAMAASAAEGVIQGLKPAPPAVQSAVINALLNHQSAAVRAVALKAAEFAAVDRKLAGFSQGVRDMARQSPTLRNEVYRAEQRGYDFINDPNDKRFVTVHSPQKAVMIGTDGLSDVEVVRHMAHEASHGANDAPRPEPTRGESRQHYIDRGVAIKLREEGRAELNNVKTRLEIIAAGGPDIGRTKPAGSDPYQTIYNDYAAGRLTWDQAVDQAASAIGNERPVMRSSGTYRDMYKQSFGDHFDNP